MLDLTKINVADSVLQTAFRIEISIAQRVAIIERFLVKPCYSSFSLPTLDSEVLRKKSTLTHRPLADLG